MSRTIQKYFALILAIAMVLLMPIHPLAHESPVDHVDRFIRLWVEGDTIFFRYQLNLSERAAMMQLKEIDANGDGTVSERERDAFFDSFAANLGKQMRLRLDQVALELKPAGRVELLPQFRQVYLFSAPTGALKSGVHAGTLSDEYSRNYPGVYGLDSASKKPEAGPRVRVTKAPKSQESAGHPAVLLLNFDVVVP